MKTIAITIDEVTLEHIDRLVDRDNAQWGSRSEIIRNAVREFIARLERAAEEDRERQIFRRHQASLKRQASALVKEQAKP